MSTRPIPRPISSGVASFGLVTIPFKLYVAAKPEEVQFNFLHDRCKSRVKQQYVCPNPACGGEVVDHAHMCKGFEYSKDSYVSFTADELKQLEHPKTASLEIVEFVPAEAIDLVQIEKSYYMGPDKGAERAYRLLALAMTRCKRVAVGRLWTHGKLQLVLVRPYGPRGLILHYLYYADEVRSFEGIAPSSASSGGALIKKGEVDLAKKLIQQLSSPTFEPRKYRDEYKDRVRAAVDQKVAGKELIFSPGGAEPAITDLFEALKRSVKP
jgi:DNA end-binding protein Ku